MIHVSEACGDSQVHEGCVGIKALISMLKLQAKY